MEHRNADGLRERMHDSFVGALHNRNLTEAIEMAFDKLYEHYPQLKDKIEPVDINK